MSYTPQVGDRVVTSPTSTPILVTAVGRERFLGIRDDDVSEGTFPINRLWRKVVERPTLPDMPDRWAAVASDRTRRFIHNTAAAALDANNGVIAAVRYTATDDVVWRDEVVSS